MRLYVNCDSVAGKADPADQWYSISEILASGVVASNGCVKPKDAAKPKEAARITAAAKPGEFVFFVRKENVWEEAQEFSSR
jgi:hypothetical protein